MKRLSVKYVDTGAMSMYNCLCREDTSIEKFYYIDPNQDVLQSDKFREWDDSMSFVCAYIASDGVVVASDTRRIVTDGETVTECRDDEQKIFQVPGTNILACITGGCRFGDHEEFTLADFINDLNGCSIDEATDSIVSKISEYTIFSGLRVTLYQPFSSGNEVHAEQRSIVFDVGEVIGVRILSSYACSGEGFTQGSDRAIDIFNELWKPGRLSVRLAVKQISVLMDIMLDRIEQENWSVKSVGGKCDMYIARLDGVEHIR